MSKKATVDTQIMSEKFSYIDESDTETEEHLLKDYTEKKLSHGDDDKVETEHEDESSQSPKLEDKTENIHEAGPSLPPEPDEIIKDEPKAGPSMSRQPKRTFRQIFDEIYPYLHDIWQFGKLKEHIREWCTYISLLMRDDEAYNGPNKQVVVPCYDEIGTLLGELRRMPELDAERIESICVEIDQLLEKLRQYQEMPDEIYKYLHDIRKISKKNTDFIRQSCDKILSLLYEFEEYGESYKSFINQICRKKCPVPFVIAWSEDCAAKDICRRIFISVFELKDMGELDAKRIDEIYIQICVDIEDFMNTTEIEDKEGDCDESDTGINDEDNNERRNFCYLFKNEPEETVLRVLQDRIYAGKKLYRDKFGYTMLHRAVQKNYLSVAELLMDSGFSPLDYAIGRIIPLHIAIYKHFDELAALIVSKLPKCVVLQMFGEDRLSRMIRHTLETTNDNGDKDIELSGTYDDSTLEQMFSMKQLISNELDKTLLQVLNSFEQFGLTNCELLDTDNERREPGHNDYNSNNRTNFQCLVFLEKKEAINHPVIRKYVDYHWNKWCRKRYLYYGFVYIISLFCLTFSVATGVIAPDVCTYDTPLNYSRAVMEVISYIYAMVVLLTEIRQIIRYKRSYFGNFFNYMDLFSAILIMCVLPLRYKHLKAHWYVFALGYFLWEVRIFKYAIIFSQSGVYVDVIKRTLLWDIIPFSGLFMIINMIFSGTFLLVLKADDSLYTHIDTSSFEGIWYVGVRTLIEAEPIVDYTGSDGYSLAGTICMLVYMFFTIVVMLNILIAQLSGTYGRTRDESIKTDHANRALVIARAQRKKRLFLLIPWSWTKHYTKFIDSEDMDMNTIENPVLEDLSKSNYIMRKKQIKICSDVQTVNKRLMSFEAKVEDNMFKLTRNLERIEQLLLNGQVDKHL